MSEVNSEILGALRLQLQEAKKDLEAYIGGRLGVAENRHGDSADVVDSLSLVEVGVMKEKRSKIDSLERAINKAKNGTYGLCNDCGQSIDEARLAVRPESSQCSSCKIKQEDINRMHPGRKLVAIFS